MRRQALGCATALLVVAAAAWWLLTLTRDRQTPRRTSVVVPTSLLAVPSSSLSPRSAEGGGTGKPNLHGRVVVEGRPVAGATVWALSQHGPDVLSDVPCPCEVDCGLGLLDSGCREGVSGLVEMLSARLGEPVPLARSSTDAMGRFSFDAVEDVEVALWVEAPFGVAWRGHLPLQAEPVDVELAEGHLLEGTVHGPDDAPLTGVLITAIFTEHSRFFETTTDDSGTYRLGPVYPGAYVLVATAPGLVPGVVHTHTEAGDTPFISLHTPRVVSGMVVSSKGAVAGASLTLSGRHGIRRVTSSRSGSFSISMLPPGEYVLEATWGLERGQRVVVLPRNRDRQDLVVELTRGVALRGTVLDDSNAPLAGVEVTVSDGKAAGAHGTISDAQGQFVFDSVQPGQHAVVVTVFKAGYLSPPPAAVSIRDDGAEVRLALRRASRLTGTVYDSGGAVVIPFVVYALPAESQATSGAAGDSRSNDLAPRDLSELEVSARSRDGHFSLDVAPGDYRLTVVAPASAPHSMLVRAPAMDLRIQLTAGGRVEGTVVDADGASMARIEVMASPLRPLALGRWSGRLARTDERGFFRMTGLSEGEHEMKVWDSARHTEARGGVEPVIARLQAGETIRVSLQARRGVHIEGVVKKLGLPVAGVRVLAQPDNSQSEGSTYTGSEVRTGPEGVFRFTGLPRGQFRLLALEEGERLSTAAAVSAPATGVTLTLGEPTVVRGRVLDESDRPIQEFRVDGLPFCSAEGRFTFASKTGEHAFVVEGPGLVTLERKTWVTSGAHDLGDLRVARVKSFEGRFATVSAGD